MLDKLKLLKGRWHTWWALSAISGVWLSVTLACLKFFHGLLVDVDVLQASDTNGKRVFYLVVAGLWLVGQIVLALVWQLKRMTPRFRGKEASVLFALHSEPKCSELVENIYERFEKSLRQRKLLDKLTYRKLPKNQTIENHEDAERLRAESNATLVVFGTFVKDMDDGKPVEEFESLSFNFSAPKDGSLKDGALRRAMIGLPLRVEEGNGLIQRPNFADSFYYLTAFFVALSLTSIGNSIDARPVWSQLRHDLKIKSTRHGAYRNLLGQVELWWARCELSYAYYLYDKYVRNNLRIDTADEYAREVLNTLEGCKRQIYHLAGYHLIKAIQYFHLGEYQVSRRVCEKGLKKIPSFRAYFEVSLGFLCLWRRMYERSIKHYERASQSMMSVEEASNSIDFIESLYDRNRDRPELLWGIAFIRDHFHINEYALEDYEVFVRESNGDKSLIRLVAYSERRLRILHKVRDKKAG